MQKTSVNVAANATKLQSLFRGFSLRRKTKAALTIQTTYLSYKKGTLRTK